MFHLVAQPFQVGGKETVGIGNISLPQLWGQLVVRKTRTAPSSEELSLISVQPPPLLQSCLSGKPPCPSGPLTLHRACGNSDICSQKWTGETTCVHRCMQECNMELPLFSPKNLPSCWGEGNPETDCRRGIEGLSKVVFYWPVTLIKNKTRTL